MIMSGETFLDTAQRVNNFLDQSQGFECRIMKMNYHKRPSAHSHEVLEHEACTSDDCGRQNPTAPQKGRKIGLLVSALLTA